MAYQYVVPVKVFSEEYLQAVENELREVHEMRLKVEEILINSPAVAQEIRDDVLNILDLPHNINIGYEILQDRNDYICIPMDCQDFNADLS